MSDRSILHLCTPVGWYLSSCVIGSGSSEEGAVILCTVDLKGASVSWLWAVSASQIAVGVNSKQPSCNQAPLGIGLIFQVHDIGDVQSIVLVDGFLLNKVEFIPIEMGDSACCKLCRHGLWLLMHIALLRSTETGTAVIQNPLTKLSQKPTAAKANAL
jgi:hypothetical protein